MAGFDELDDDDVMEMFETALESDGIVVTVATDGVVIGLTAEKLAELKATADAHEDKRVVLFIPDSDEVEVIPELKN